MDIGLDYGYLHPMPSSPPLCDLGGGGRLPLAIEADHQDRLVVGADVSRRAEDSDQLAVYHVHGMGLELQAWSGLLLHQPPFYPLCEVLRLPDIEVGLQEGPPQ